jgi:GH24 family phage-related lysozyme (muramidase)
MRTSLTQRLDRDWNAHCAVVRRQNAEAKVEEAKALVRRKEAELINAQKWLAECEANLCNAPD